MPENPLAWIPFFGRAAPGVGILMLFLSGVFFYLRKGSIYAEAIAVIRLNDGEISLPQFVMQMNLRPAQAKALLKKLMRDGIVSSGFTSDLVEKYSLADRPIITEFLKPHDSTDLTNHHSELSEVPRERIRKLPE